MRRYMSIYYYVDKEKNVLIESKEKAKIVSQTVKHVFDSKYHKEVK